MNLANNNDCYGISSQTLDGKHIVMVDSDIPITQYGNFLNMLRDLQHDYQLSDFYIFITKNGFNAFTLDKLELDFLTNILYSQPLIDEKFIYFNHLRGYYTLKFNSDKKFLRVLCSRYNTHELSYAHCIFFTDIFNIDIPESSLFDDYSEMDIINY